MYDGWGKAKGMLRSAPSWAVTIMMRRDTTEKNGCDHTRWLGKEPVLKASSLPALYEQLSNRSSKLEQQFLTDLPLKDIHSKQVQTPHPNT
jgi:hypothetical protein